MKCPSCLKNIPKGSLFCIHCGVNVKGSAAITESTSPSQNETIIDPQSTSKSSSSNSMATADALLISKSFIGSAFLAWLLYYIGIYIVGLILNISYLGQAKSIKKASGSSPSGMGCLQLLLITHFWIPLIALVIVFFLSIGSSITIMELIEEFWLEWGF